MKNLLLLLSLIFLFSCGPTPEQGEATTQAASMEETEATTTSEATDEKVLRHVVLFKFKDSASEADVKSVSDAFSGLPGKIPEILDYEWGTNNSPEGLDQGFTHCFLVTFKSEADREVYLPHPAHKAFVEVLQPHLDKVLVIDYWNK